MANQPTGPIFTNLLLGLLTTAFIAWSAVVWQAVSQVELLAERMHTIISRVERHEVKRWHDEAGTRIHVLEERVRQLSKDSPSPSE